jgi:hypothetical protein
VNARDGFEPGAGDDDAPGRVRPYALVRGRTRSGTAPTLPVEALVVATAQGMRSRLPLEGGDIVRRCARPSSLAELSAHLKVPVGVIRVLVGDLAEARHVDVHLPLDGHTTGDPPERSVLERCLAKLESL